MHEVISLPSYFFFKGKTKSHTLTHTHTHSHALTHTHTHSHTLTHTHTHSHIHSHALALQKQKKRWAKKDISLNASGQTVSSSIIELNISLEIPWNSCSSPKNVANKIVSNYFTLSISNCKKKYWNIFGCYNFKSTYQWNWVTKLLLDLQSFTNNV